MKRIVIVVIQLFIFELGYSNLNVMMTNDILSEMPNDTIGPRVGRAVYLEIFGTGGFLSLNFDSRLETSMKLDGVGYRIGLSVGQGFTLPMEINYKMGGKHALVFGGGFTMATQQQVYDDVNPGSFFISISFSMKYRFQPVRKGFFFQFGLDAFPDKPVVRDGSIWGGLGMGYSF